MGSTAGLAAVPTVSQSLTSMLLSGSGLRGLHLDTSLGGTMFAYAALVAITATFLIGLMPALQVAPGALSQHIKDGQHVRHARGRRKPFRSIYVFGGC